MPAPTCPTCNLVLLGSRCRQCGHVPDPVEPIASHRTAQPVAPPPPVAQAVAPSWQADPSGRHQYRYWDGQGWTDHVADYGVAAVDPLRPAAPVAPPPPPAGPAQPWPPVAGNRFDVASAVERLAGARDQIAANPTAQALARSVKEAGARAKEAAANRTRPTTPAPPTVGGPPQPNPDGALRPASVTATGPSGPRPAGAGPQPASAAKQMTAGDAIVKGLSIVTLNSWASKRMAEAFMIPELIEAVSAAPQDPTPRLHLGLRLLEMERLSSRIKRSVAPASGTALLLRPVTRPLGRAAVRALKSDNTPASEKALESAYEAAMVAISRKPRNPEALDALARIYHAKGHHQKAIEVATASVHADPRRPDPYYIAAEACFDLGAAHPGQQWAAQAAERGSTLVHALLHPSTGRLRAEFTSTKANMLNMPTTMKYWQHKGQYFAPANPAEVRRFHGPSPAAP